MMKALREPLAEIERKDLRDLQEGLGNISRYVDALQDILVDVLDNDKQRNEKNEATIRYFLREILQELHHGDDLAKHILREEIEREREER